jgi:2-polyprenyl-6-methoxyphenol hydroxylase-like FAD-dependent oxidoreductase
MIPANTDVLIVGAGPTGLMLANQLARRGIEFVIIDRHAGPSIETRAIGVQARTLEIYAHLGIAEKAVELGVRGTGANIWAKGRRGANVPLVVGSDKSPYPFLLILGQDDNERLLGEILNKRGIQVQWSTELSQIAQYTDHAIATVRQTDGSTREVRARWIGGCDGAHSAVRNLNGIEFIGAPYEHVFYVADTTATGPMVASQLNVYLFREGFHLFFPMRGTDHWRVVGILPAELAQREDLKFNDVEPSIIRESGIPITFQECRWFSKYRIHHRRAEKFRDRRCFLMGDAAHIHSPVGAQGMNTGLQDAYNLAWKLALVISGRVAENLVDSYAAERIPVAESLLKGTDTAFSIVVSDSWLSKILRTRVIAKVAAVAMKFQRMQNFAFRTISQIGIHYPASPLSQTLEGLPQDAPRAGDRFPWMKLKFSPESQPEDLFTRLDDTRFNLIAIGQPANSGALPDDLFLWHEVSDDSHNRQELARYHIPYPSFFLLRPDCYIGLAGTRLDSNTLSRYLKERLQLRL